MTTCKSCVMLGLLLLACTLGCTVGIKTDAQAMVSILINIILNTTYYLLTTLYKHRYESMAVGGYVNVFFFFAPHVRIDYTHAGCYFYDFIERCKI